MSKLLSAALILRPSLLQTSLEVDSLFEEILANENVPEDRLRTAMRYATVGGGKRLRPLLVNAAGALFGVPHRMCVLAGLAVEALHVHSLIHDDLPCMDDDDLRRGKPTVHKAFDEATAVLAGDALMAFAFELLSDPATHPDAAVRCELVMELAKAAGAAGMAGGQMLDLMPAATTADITQILRLQRLKTGALIGWCVEAGAIMGYAAPTLRTALRGYASCLGLAFQIRDDLLDVNGDEEAAGKKVGKDDAQGKQTIVSLLGVEAAGERAELLVAQAIDHLKSFGDDADLLRTVAKFAVERDR